jgi:hypothetical protein
LEGGGLLVVDKIDNIQWVVISRDITFAEGQDVNYFNSYEEALEYAEKEKEFHCIENVDIAVIVKEVK